MCSILARKNPNFQDSVSSWKEKPSSSIIFSSAFSKLCSGSSSSSHGRPRTALSGFVTGTNVTAVLLFFGDGEGLLKSITLAEARRALKVLCSLFTRTGDPCSQAVHPKLAVSVSTLMGSRCVSRAKKLCPSVYLSRQVDWNMKRMLEHRIGRS